jgi:ketohexokinase
MTTSEFQAAVQAIAPAAECGEGWFFHFEGRIPKTTFECMEFLYLYYPEAKVSLECEKPERKGLEVLADSFADVVFYSHSWAVAKGYTSAAECVTRQAQATNPYATRLFLG